VAVGARDLGIERGAVAVVLGDEALHRGTFGQRRGVRVAHLDHAVVGETDHAGIEVSRQLGEARFHRRGERADLRRADVEVGRLILRLGRRDQHLERTADDGHEQ
jgi:hypothetical protein